MALEPSPLEQSLLQALSHRTPDQNPFLFLSDELDAQLLPTLPSSAAKQLYFLAALYGLAGSLILISQAVRWRKGIVWLYRYQPEYSIIRPHATLSWSTLALVVVGLFELLIARTIQLANGDSRADYGYILLLVWGSAWVAGAVATWSIAASYIVHLHTSGSRRAPPKFVSIACNFLGIASPVVYLAILLPLGIIAGQRYGESHHTAVRIKRLLAEEAQTWTPEIPFSVSDLAPVLPVLDHLVNQITGFVFWWKAVFMFYLITALVVLFGIAPISIVYLSSLRKTIKKTNRDLHQSSLASTSRSQKQIHHTWLALVLLTTAFSLLATIFFVVSLYAFLRPTSLRQNSTFEGLIFTPLYAFGGLGLPCAIVLVIRAVEARSSDKKLEKKKMTGSRAGVGSDSSSGCWTALWNGHGIRSKTSSGGGGTGQHVDHDVTTVARNGERGSGPHAKDSIFINIGDMLRGGGKLSTSTAGHDRGGSANEARFLSDSRGSRRREPGGVGASVMVDVEVEVREEKGGDDELEEKVLQTL